MASLFLNSLAVPPPSQPRKLTETASSPSSSSLILDGNNHGAAGSLKPIVVSGNPPTFVSAPGHKIIAVGDLHGDLRKARSALQMAGVLSPDDQNLWTGGETVLIQLGDILDRGEDEIAILSLLRSLDIQAKVKGGAVFQVNGNHETMNVEGDFRFVASGAFDECTDFLEYMNDSDDDWEETFSSWVDVSERWKEARSMSNNYWGTWNLVKRQKGVITRSILFRPGGPLACELARNPVVLKVNDWVFCHGGLLPHHVAYGIERMNNEVSHWMRGLSENDSAPKIPFKATRGYDSVVWNRLYSRDMPDLEDYQINQINSILEETLQAIGAKAMVVGHTPQTTGVNCHYMVQSACWLSDPPAAAHSAQLQSDRTASRSTTPSSECSKYNCGIWCIDVGMSSGVLNSRPEVLEIRGNEARAIRSKRDRYSELQAVEYT